MSTSDSDLVSEVRSFGQYDNTQLSNGEIETAISRAKSHLLSETRLRKQDIDWYGVDEQEEALFWTAMLFTKIQTGTLDAPETTAGALTEGELLANEDGEVTTWYENYEAAKSVLATQTGGSRITRSARTSSGGSRTYEKRDEL